MADSQIVNSQVADAQSVYQVPDSVRFILKAVNADYADNGAATAWLPAVVIGSDSGHVIARAVDQAVSVAAGGSAAVSFFPGVKHAGGGVVSTVSDEFAPQQFANVFGYDRAGSDWVGFGTPTIDAACVYNGYVASSGAQFDFLDMRFSLGPKGSLWWFELMYLTGPNFGEMFGYLGTPHEDGPGSGEPDPTNLLTPIDASAGDFTYRLAFKVTCWSAVLTRNVTAFVGGQKTGLNPYAASQLRIGGNVGDTLTTFTVPAGSNFVTGDGGPGVYALKIVAGDKVGISTGYKLAIQSVFAHRSDYEWA